LEGQEEKETGMGSRNAGTEEPGREDWRVKTSSDPTLVAQKTAAARERIVSSRESAATMSPLVRASGAGEAGAASGALSAGAAAGSGPR
jgi:hypothetical protein